MFRRKSAVAYGVGFIFAASMLFAEGDPQRGRKVFDRCASCHLAYYPEQRIGPSLKGLFRRQVLVNGKPVNESSIRTVIRTGGNAMPGFRDLPDQDVADLIAFLKTL